MKDLLLLGAGNIGEMITEMLSTSGDYTVTVADLCEETLNRCTNLRMPCHRWRGTEAKRCVLADKTKKALRVHRIDGREELVEINVFGLVAGHC